MNSSFVSVLRVCLLFVLIGGMVFQPQSAAYATAILTIEPITWNVIGLDSNNVNVGPNDFPVGARVCNTSTAGETLTGITATFALANTNPYISYRPGTSQTYSGYTLAPSACVDFYFEVEVTRTAAAYDTTEQYTITVDSNETSPVSTPTPRELYVEHLVSQNRNAVTDVLLDGVSIPAGGTMNLMVGNTYTITLVGFTATQGYEQLESFINIPNTIFQINSVSTSYSAPSSHSAPRLYANSCNWENDPNSPNYRSCLGVGKEGGDITVTYNVTILQVPSGSFVNPQPLSTLIYDFSGSSYHYNSDFGVSTRYAYIVNASLTKSFSPKTILAGGTSTLTFSITNPGSSSISSVSFTDTLPSGLTIATSSTTQCSGTLTTDATTRVISLSGATIAGNSTCTFSVSVSSSTNGTYNNTTNDLFIGTTDTGSYGSDTLIVSSQPSPPTSCTTPTTMATWTLENYTASTSTNNGPFSAASQASDVTTATGTYGSVTGSSSGVANGTTSIAPTGWSAPSATGNSGNSWGIHGGWLDTDPATPATATTPYFQFQVSASNYGGFAISASYNMQGNWSNSGNWYVLTSTDGTTWTALNNGAWDKSNSWHTGITGTTTTTGNANMYFRIFAAGAQYSGSPPSTTGTFYLDGITITGCPRPSVPNLSKSFSPATISTGSTSTLTFTLTNPNTTTALTGVSFTDVLPDGLTVTSGSSTACTTGTLTRTSPKTISLSGGTIAASGTCTINVTVTGTIAGSYDNVSSSVSSTETGPNTTSSGIGTSSLTVIDPPVINKSFTANPIFTGNTTTLSFTITNPNTSVALTGVSFTDTLPSGLDVTNSSTSQCGGTLTTTNNAPAQDTVALSGGSLAAGSSCTISVTVTGTTAGLKSNSVTVSSTNGGTGNTSTADVLVKDATPLISVLKQVGSSASGPWGSFLTATVGSNVYYKFTVENIGDVTLNPVTITDNTLSLAGCTWTDGDGTVLTAPYSLPVADANNNQLMTCVLGPFTAVSGSHVNIATATGTSGTTTDSSSATYGTPALTLVKSVTQTSFTSVGDPLDYSYLVTNTGFAPLLGPVTVTDDKATVTCPLVNTVGDLDDWLDVGESITCNATYTVVANPDVSPNGFVTNTATATVSGVDSNPDSETVYRIPDFTVSKTNNVSGTVAQNGTFNWTITVSQISTGQGTFADTQTILSDTLPGTDAYYTLGSLIATPGGTAPTGTINCSIVNGPSLNCVASGAVTFPSGASFSITFAVTPTAAGTLSNTATVDANGSLTELDETNNSSTNVVTVVAPPSIAKSFAPNPILVGGTSTLTFTITNPNTGTPLMGVAFTDILPGGLTVATATTAQCGGTLTTTSPDTISLTSATIAASGTCSFNVTVTGASSGVKNNTTQNVTSTNGGTGNTANATLTVNPAADLSLTKTVNNATPNVGTNVTFTITVTNGGPDNATNVAVSDVLPAGLTFVSATPSQGTYTSGTGLWTVGTINTGSNATLDIVATVTTTGAKTNTAEVSASDQADPDSTPNNNIPGEDDQASVALNPQIADLSLTKTVNNATPNVGANVTFTITVANAGPDAATNVAVSDVLPAGLTFVSATPSQGTYNSGTGVWTVGTINNSANATLDIVATVTTAGAKDNYVQVSAVDQIDPDSTPNDGSTNQDDDATVTVTPVTSTSADLSLTKTVNNAAPNVGTNVTFTITVANAGPDAATNVAVSDVLPAGLTFVSATPSQGTYNSGTGVWTVGTINNGANATLTITATVTTTGAKTNTAEVSASDQTDPDSTPNNNIAGEDDQASVTLIPQVADLSLTKTVNNAAPNVGTNVTFTITVTNAGPDTATNVAVSDVLPAGLTFVSATPSQGTYTSGTGLWTVGTINTGANATLDIVATVTTTGAKTNTAEVSASDQTDPDSTPNNNIAGEDDQASVTLNPTAALIADPALSKAGNPSQASVGDTVTFTLTVTNAGNAPAPNVVVTDTLPAQFDVTGVTVNGAPGLTLVNVTPPIGTGPAPYTVVVTLGGNLGVTDVVTITITTIVNSQGNPPINNTAWVTTSAPTNIAANDSDTVTITLRKPNPTSLVANRPAALPATGFAPKIETKLPAQPQDMMYTATDVLLEIPSLGIKIPIVGVPKKNGTWDVSWLGKQAGWLEGSAFPSWSGNSVLTSHVYASNGLPGPFVNLNKLKYGDQIIVHAYGQKYIFEVQTNQVVAPSDTSAFKHEEKSWLTLITCKEYDEKTNSYRKRVIVRAVLVKVVWDK